ncbi:MAG: hypothetical protein LBF15_03535 [Candidatus Peribacteria bacterium]|jgi:hypothetical protein|nr:hypothetical protein [Candidatus Peribacteria bacterium]
MPVSKGELGEMLVKIGQERAAIMKSVPKVNEVIPSRNTVLKVEKEI